MGDMYMRIRWVLISMFCFFFGLFSVNAQVCDKEDVERVRAVANNLVPKYDYIGYEGNWQLYVLNFDFGEYAGKLSFAESNRQGASPVESDLSIQSGKRSIDIFYKACANYKIATISVDIPYFNEYAARTECIGLEDVLDICNPDYEGKITDNSFNEEISKYEEESVKKEFDLFEFVKKYYFYFIGVCVALIIIIIGLVIHHNKHYKLD